MADNLTTQSGTPATVPAASVIATDDVSSVHFQKVKLDVGGDGVSVPASGDATNGLDVDVTRVQGTVTVGDGGGTISVDDGGGTLTVDGTVAVTGAYQATQPVSLATAPTTPVTGTFWQATQPVSGTVGVTGVATAANQLPDGHNVVVTSAPTTAVTGTFYPATQNVDVTVNSIGLATAAKQDDLLTELQLKADLTETQPTSQKQIATATLSNVAASVTSVTALASNPNRRMATIHNDSTSVLYLKFAATASATSYTVKMAADSYYEIPVPVYTGVIDGIWVTATGSARVTEMV